MMNQVTDHGMLGPTMEGIRSDTPGEVLEVVADKGYEDEKDIIKCLEDGIIPHVITADGKDGYELKIPYEEAEADTSSTDSEALKKSLHAGKIPEAYKEVITEIKVEEVRRKVKCAPTVATDGKPEPIYGTPEEMQEQAKEVYFVRDPEWNLFYCPAAIRIKANGKRLILQKILLRSHVKNGWKRRIRKRKTRNGVLEATLKK